MNVVRQIDWRQETMRYDTPHRRLVLMSRLLRTMPERRLLDLGCSTGALRKLLPPDYEYYGCDVTDHAARVLSADRFRQMDFNAACDLSPFAGWEIDVLHIGGLLEYLQRPEELLRSARKLVRPGSRLVLSIINFQAAAYAQPASHHAGWTYKPRLDDLRRTLARQGWHVERQIPFLGKGRLREGLFRQLARWRGVDHPWTRRHTRQFILLARAT